MTSVLARVPATAINVSATFPASAVVSRNDPAEQDRTVAYGEGDALQAGAPRRRLTDRSPWRPRSGFDALAAG
jgi:hypothetical protein